MSSPLHALINSLYHNPVIARIFHTSVYCLQRELRGMEKVLDLGCGPDSPLKHCRISYSVGVEGYPAYAQASREKGIHQEYVVKDLREVEFPDRSFDAVVMVEVIEHLEAAEGQALLKKAERWAKRKVIVTTPNGFVAQQDKSGNPLQQHKSGWTAAGMRALGYRCYGMAGYKFLRKENDAPVMEDAEAIFATIRWRPKLFWMAVSELTQAFAYYQAPCAFGLFCVKTLEDT